MFDTLIFFFPRVAQGVKQNNFALWEEISQTKREASKATKQIHKIRNRENFLMTPLGQLKIWRACLFQKDEISY